jgi:hypothetical protein
MFSSGILHNWSQRYLRDHGLFGGRLCGWVLEFVRHIVSFCWCLVALNVRRLQLTLDGPWNVNAIAKPLSDLKNVLQKPHEEFQGFRKRSYLASRKTWRRHVARFCHPSQTKRNTKSKKYSCKNNACSQGGVTWQTYAAGLRKCDLTLPSHLLSPRQLQQ